MEQITPTNKNKIKVIVLVIALLIVAGVAAAFFIPSQEERIQNYKEQKREEKIQEKVNQTEGNVSEENNGSSSGDTTGETVSGSVSFGEDYTVATEKDIVYATVNGMSLKIDIYTPIGVTGATPAVLYIHGGGFHGGSKNGVADDSVMLAKHGIASVAIDYRLSGTAVFPAPLHDVKGVARYVKAHASEYNINPDALFTLGESAGGVLASLMGVTEGNTALEGTVGGNTGYNSNIAGVINISGSYVASIVDTMSSGIQNAISSETGCSPVPSTACESTYEALSPETYINAGDSPFLILHGDKDRSVPTIQATTLDTKLGAVGVASDVYVASDLAHVGGLLSRYLTQVISFINTNS
ncbi:MAG: alpha/beta hydrolase [Candidatus Pacebacteria bacterium]|jgi:acetyl esterase/lipase|nr:alpha/beta hydrolase [Candidatus Paceibacterota bacterium]MBP9058616.1 alpha/beta hydrolase [Candidatus Paceibacterota bacterium]MBP9770233.1 alpha/beta hydrolase [Candidatus Paceibacterota bacterium]